jgi:branched-chain amino acid transport system substrate-binding protein
VQFGFTNTHPDFTFAGGDFTWSISVTQAQLSPALADFAVERLGLKNLAVFQINNDWGLATYDLFVPRAEELGATIVSTQSYLPEDTDFRSALTTIRNSDADGIILISYAPDAALIAQQARDTGIDLPFIGSGSLQTADFLTLGAEAVEGTQLIAQFLPSDPRPAVQDFVEAYDAAYEEVPDLFAVIAYDSMNVIAEAIRLGGATREGVLEGLRELEDVPSVLYGSITFDPETRRVLNPQFVDLVVKEGAFVAAEIEAGS